MNHCAQPSLQHVPCVCVPRPSPDEEFPCAINILQARDFPRLARLEPIHGLFPRYSRLVNLVIVDWCYAHNSRSAHRA